MKDFDLKKYPQLAEVIDFHGHMCPGLAIGYRAALAGLDRLTVKRARDEELVAIVENDSCSVDALQYLAGTTFGKGNLFFRDWGKQVFTFGRRDGARAVRVALKSQGEEMSREERTAFILDAPVDELFDIREVDLKLPPRAEIHRSVRCDICGEQVMETRTMKRDGKTLCPECAANG